MRKLTIGVDEVGAGPLAGPLYVCAVAIFDDEKKIVGVNDSKKISASKREQLYPIIEKSVILKCFQSLTPEEIDQINIYEARRKGMRLAIEKIKDDLNKKGYSNQDMVVKVDGTDLKLFSDGNIKVEYIVGGDQVEYAISCASILAKVTRDNIMIALGKKFPEYKFEKNKGYGSAEHIAIIKKIGICEIHRKTFCKNFL